MRRSTRLLAVAVGVAVPLSPGTGAVTTVSGPSQFAGCRDGQPKVVPDAEVEPSLAVDPRDAHRIVAVYQQDRFRDGAARGIAAAASTDGGRSWRRSVLPVGPCATGKTGPPFRLSDPWVSIGPDGRVYALASSYAVTSRDGGRTWTPPVELAQASPGYLFDKGSLTADPARAGVAYAVWARFHVPAHGPPVESDAMLAKTTDGGRTWSQPKVILPGAGDEGTIGSIVVADPLRRRLYHFTFWQVGVVPTVTRPSRLLVQSSSDGGSTWSRPRTVAQAYTVALHTREAYSREQIRTGFTVPSFAVDRRTGVLYAAWQDARFSGKRFDQIAFASSRDAGRTWTAPVRLSAASWQGFVPTAAVTAAGVVGVAYYETPSAPSRHPVPTRYRLAVSRDGGRSFTRRTVGPAFDLARAPLMESVPALAVPPGLFLGDYMGIAAAGRGFDLAFVTTNRNAGNPTDVRFNVAR